MRARAPRRRRCGSGGLWRTLVLVGSVALAPAAGVGAGEDDAAALQKVEDYLNALTTLEADFVQVSPEGEISEGKLYIARPWRLRVEYAPPVPVLMVADGTRLIFYDRELGQVTELPLSSTPFGLLLAKRISLEAQAEILDVAREASVLRVTVARKDAPEAGTLTLVFTESPFELRQWVLVDAQGLATRVTLLAPRFGGELDPALFTFERPRPGGTRPER